MQISARDILAKTIQAEAGNQGPVGMLSVGSVIMNRLMSGSYPNKLHDVILQPGQFSAWNKTTGYADGLQGQDMSFTPSDAAYSVADQLLDTNYNDPTGGATHFYNPAISNPAWGKTAGGNWKTIGDHVFGTPANKDTTMSTILNNSPVIAATSNNPTSQQPMSGMNSNPLFKMLGNAVGGGFDQLKNAVTGRDPDAADRLAIGLMQLSGQPQQFAPLMQLAANDIQERKKLRQTNKTIEYLETIDPKLAEMARNNPSMVTAIMQQVTSQMLNPKNKKSTITGAELKKVYPNAPTTIKDGELYNVEFDSEGKVVKANPVGKTQFNFGGDNNPSEKIDEKLFGNLGETFEEYLDIGNKSAAIMTDLRVLESLVPVQPTGTIPGAIARMFPQLDNAAAMRQSIVSRIAPLLRVEGSGSTSDIEFEAMLNSYGSLLNTPEANAAILSIFRMKQEFNVARAAIVREYITSTDPNKVTIAMEKMAELEAQSGIPEAVKTVISQYTDPNIAPVQNNPENNPGDKTWDPNANDGAGGFV